MTVTRTAEVVSAIISAGLILLVLITIVVIVGLDLIGLTELV